uniref:Serine/threonine protein phosphatase 7 long form isogeny n=1 Tax=Cajanus cajan TaxID=3821 RepID=A0A151SP68_CAJCA|nr:Serine/threonine protein phosphatase 7 long form isogeny [Cajanus cajan]
MPEPHPLIVLILEEVGFSGITNLRHLKVDHALVTTLVERWRPETHTFHFPTGECTIILEDVVLQLGLRVDGLPVIGPILYDRLRIVPVKCESLIGSMIKLKWLRENMLELAEEPSQEELHAYYNKVHLMYLSLLINLRKTRRYSWGSACLAMLYREMCRATDVSSKTISGCASLLQSWTWHRMPYIFARGNVDGTLYGMRCHVQDCNKDAQPLIVLLLTSVALHISLYNIAKQADPQLYRLVFLRFINKDKYIRCTLLSALSGIKTPPIKLNIYALQYA